MAVDVKNLPPPSEEEIRWMERVTEGEDDFPGASGGAGWRRRLRKEAAARQRKFDEERDKLRRHSLPRAA